MSKTSSGWKSIAFSSLIGIAFSIATKNPWLLLIGLGFYCAFTIGQFYFVRLEGDSIVLKKNLLTKMKVIPISSILRFDLSNVPLANGNTYVVDIVHRSDKCIEYDAVGISTMNKQEWRKLISTVKSRYGTAVTESLSRQLIDKEELTEILAHNSAFEEKREAKSLI